MTREEREELLVERITKITKIALVEELNNMGIEVDKYFNEAILQALIKAAKVGMKFADEHPDDVRTMAAWQSGYNEAVDKACEWIHSALYLDHERSIEHRYTTLEELLNDFRKAMKGDEE